MSEWLDPDLRNASKAVRGHFSVPEAVGALYKAQGRLDTVLAQSGDFSVAGKARMKKSRDTLRDLVREKIAEKMFD